MKKKPFKMPPPGVSVRLVVKNYGELYGDVLPVTMKSGRLPLLVWGTQGRTFCFAKEDLEGCEVIEATQALVQRVAAKQRPLAQERSPFNGFGESRGKKGSE